MREGGAENALDLTSKLSDGSMNPVQTAEKLNPASMSAKGQGKKGRRGPASSVGQVCFPTQGIFVLLPISRGMGKSQISAVKCTHLHSLCVLRV